MSDAGFARNSGTVMKTTLRNIGTNGPREFSRALAQETDIEVRECRRNTPEDTGDLRSTVRRVGPEIDGRRIRSGVAAGDGTVLYAMIVHEDLEAHHRVGKAKYIEDTLQESRPYMGERIARRIDLNRMTRRGGSEE